MKTVLVLSALFTIILASKAEIKLLKQQQSLRQNTREILEFQHAILRLFRNINQPDYYKDQKEIAVNYDIEDNIDNYDNRQAVMEFWELNRLGFLPKDEIFSIFNQRHRREVIALFKIFYYAKDYTTLYKTACWARLFMNEGLFVYSLSVALVQRSDTAMIDLPPIYEIYPEYFYNSDVIRETQKARQLYKDRPRTPVEPIQDPHSTETYPNPTEYGTTVETPAERSIDEKLNGQPNQPQPSYPPWYAFLPETLHPMWMNPQYRMGPDAMTEQLAQAQIMQEQLRSKLSSKLEDQDGIDPNTFNGITIDANYSRQGGDVNRELILSYFTEDVGLSAYYYYYNIYYPFWLPNELINFETDRRGEQFYYMIQQLLARYYLERLSNGLGDVAILDYMMPIRTGYYPLMSYPNGRKFPVRPDKLWLRMERAMENTRFDNNYTNSYAFVRDYERRIKDAIDLGYVTTSTGKQIYLYDESGFETLGNMIEGNMESPNGRFYGSLQIFARMLLGNVQPLLEQQEYVIVPSVLEHFETSLRDPVFYQFFKRMLMHFQRYLNNVPPYSTKELLMPGVKIEDVEIDERLTTYFENYYVDISNAVYSKNIGHDVRRIPVRVRQMRLNHEPFRYTMNINSDKAYAGLVKVFIGPKYDEIGRRLEITESRLDFVEIDKFPVSLTPGMNNIRRSSSENFYSRDRTSYREMYKRIMLAISTPSFSKYEPRDPEWSMPQRLLLPKGDRNGQTYRMYYIIVPYKPMKDQIIKSSGDLLVNWLGVMDTRPLGYPLDRPIDENDFYVPNSFFKDVVITHEGLKTDL